MRKKIILLLGFGLLLVGCKSHKNLPKNDAPKVKFEKVYQKYKGVKYRYGGTTSRGFDCSGFVQRAYMDAYGKTLPRTTKSMMKIGKKVSKNHLKPGDLVFFHPTSRYYHVGIYLGDGIFMHASSSKGVIKSRLDLKYWKKSYITARRVL